MRLGLSRNFWARRFGSNLSTEGRSPCSSQVLSRIIGQKLKHTIYHICLWHCTWLWRTGVAQVSLLLFKIYTYSVWWACKRCNLMQAWHVATRNLFGMNNIWAPCDYHLRCTPARGSFFGTSACGQVKHKGIKVMNRQVANFMPPSSMVVIDCSHKWAFSYIKQPVDDRRWRVKVWLDWLIFFFLATAFPLNAASELCFVSN